MISYEEIRYLLEERTGIGIFEGGLDELKAKQQARRDVMAILKDSGMKIHEAVYEIFKAEKEVCNERN